MRRHKPMQRMTKQTLDVVLYMASITLNVPATFVLKAERLIVALQQPKSRKMEHTIDLAVLHCCVQNINL